MSKTNWPTNNKKTSKKKNWLTKLDWKKKFCHWIKKQFCESVKWPKRTDTLPKCEKRSKKLRNYEKKSKKTRKLRKRCETKRTEETKLKKTKKQTFIIQDMFFFDKNFLAKIKTKNFLEKIQPKHFSNKSRPKLFSKKLRQKFPRKLFQFDSSYIRTIDIHPINKHHPISAIYMDTHILAFIHISCPPIMSTITSSIISPSHIKIITMISH